ncbi:MAG: hypothetical protein IJK47_05020 [Lachnospiraceae bacterium]|nr:hypothetical protein [Lachnospiraceae bacterium]
MKKVSILLCLVFVLALAGCGNNSTANKAGSNQPAGVNDVIEQGMAEADSKKAGNTSQPAESNTQKQQNTKSQETQAPGPSSEPNTDSAAAGSADGVDVDLTKLSSTMVYSEVYNMMVSPEKYIGKTVKMKGLFAYYHDEAADIYYFACIIQDATACCAQGIEFVLTEDYTYPDDYPEVNEEICVVGVFDTYQEGDYTYCTLRNAKFAF